MIQRSGEKEELPQTLGMTILRRSSRVSAKEIATKENVAFMTVGIKRVDGSRTGQKALIVYVVKKMDVEEEQRIPSSIKAIHNNDALPKDIPTDVVEIFSRPQTFGARAGNILISSAGKQGVCGFAFVKDQIGYILTNAHVGCDMTHGGAPSLLSLINPPTGQLIRVGPVVWSSGLNPQRIATDDSAVARADYVPVDPAMIINMPQPVTGEGVISGDQSVTYWYSVNGATFLCGHPEPIAYPASIEVDGLQIRYQNFWVMQMLQGIVGPGHSGSLLCRDGPSGPIACGLLFGGSAPTKVFAFSFKPIFDRIFSLLP